MRFLTLFALIFAGCSCDPAPRSAPSHYNQTRTVANAPSGAGETKNGVTTEDFALDVVIQKAQELPDIPALEKWINEVDGVTRVDLDNDGNLDFIQIQTSSDGGGQRLTFVAWPNNEKNYPEGLPIAEASITKQGDQVVVTGGYPQHVGGYAGVSYHHSSPLTTLATGYLLGRMLSPGWAYHPPYMGYTGGFRGYYGERTSLRGTPGRSSFNERRSETRTTVSRKVGPIKRKNDTSGFKPSKTANSVPSRYKREAPKTKSGVTGFQRRPDRAKPNTRSAFGNRSAAKRSAPRRSTKRPSRARATPKRSPSRTRSPSRSRPSRSRSTPSRSRSSGGRRR